MKTKESRTVSKLLHFCSYLGGGGISPAKNYVAHLFNQKLFTIVINDVLVLFTKVSFRWTYLFSSHIAAVVKTWARPTIPDDGDDDKLYTVYRQEYYRSQDYNHDHHYDDPDEHLQSGKLQQTWVGPYM